VSATELRPLGVGEILDVAIKAYTANARTLIAIGAIVGVPFELLSGVIQLSTVSSADQVGGSLMAGSGGSVDYSRARIAGVVVTLLIGFFVSLVLTASTVKAVSDAYLGNVPNVRDSILFALRRIRSLIWLYFVLGVGLALAAIALVIPAIWLYVSWSVATPVLLLEDVRGTAALRRSFRLVRRRWWPAAGVLLMAFVIVGVAEFVIAGLLAVIPLAVDDSSVLLAVVASTISSVLVAAAVKPVQAAITTILYFDLRVRKEGFDLSLLAARLGLPEPDLPDYVLRDGPAGLSDWGQLDGRQEAPPFWPPPPGWAPSAPPPAPAEHPAPDEASTPAEHPAPDEASTPAEHPSPDEAPTPAEHPSPDEAPTPAERPSPGEAPAGA
jgi:hypothetical protein